MSHRGRGGSLEDRGAGRRCRFGYRRHCCHRVVRRDRLIDHRLRWSGHRCCRHGIGHGGGLARATRRAGMR